MNLRNRNTRNDSTQLQLIRVPIFKPITIESLEEIRTVLQRAPSRSCDYSVGGIYLWVGWFNYQYCIIENTLFIKGQAENNPHVTAFSMPIGNLSLELSIDMLRQYCRLHGITPVLSAIPEDCMEQFAHYLPNATIEPLENWSDYVYDAESLATLAGKKLQKKRNHVNRFVADNPHYCVEDITAENIGEVAKFYTALSSDGAENETLMAAYEAGMVSRVLTKGNELNFEGALLRDETGEIVAFTFGEVIGDTLHVHIEKMKHEVAGAGVAITKMYAELMLKRHPQIRYINRQDDAGDMGLRQAKLTYNPSIILKKYNIILNRI